MLASIRPAWVTILERLHVMRVGSAESGILERGSARARAKFPSVGKLLEVRFYLRLSYSVSGAYAVDEE